MFVRSLRSSFGRAQCFHISARRWASRKTLQKFNLADIGEGITECEIIKWNIKPMSSVQAFDPLCEVQSDKASVEITSPFDGVVKELLVQEGEVAKVGAGLCLIEVDEELSEGSEPPVTEPPSEPGSDTSNGASHPPPLAPTTEPIRPKHLHPLDPKNTSYVDGPTLENVFAAPSVRHFARQNSVDLGRLAPGTGKAGRIEKRDVEAYLAGHQPIPSQESTLPHANSPPSTNVGEDVVVDLGRTRYGMWKAMVKSLEIPHFGYSTTLDLTDLHNIVPQLNAHIPSHFLPQSSRSPSRQFINPSALYPAPSLDIPESQQFTRLTYLPVLLKTLSKAMLEWPLFRSSITPSASESGSSKPTLTIRPNADISIALSTPSGLYTPTIQNANSLSVYALAAQLTQLSHLGRQMPCGLTVKEMPKRGGTITVSNVGAIGAGDFASPVLVPGGGVAIVALGRAKWVWDVERGDGKGERRLKMGISWSGDHRVVEGAELAAFVECWRSYVENPVRLIGEGV